MKCSEVQFELSLYADGTLDGAANDNVRSHLDVCPVCREYLAELAAVKANLRQSLRPAMPSAFHRTMRSAVLGEARRRSRSSIYLPLEVREWLRLRIMPYGIGAFASVMLGFGFLMMMFSGSFRPEPLVARGPEKPAAVMLASSFDPYRVGSPDDISASDLVRSRMSVAGESPSVNPQGALIAMTKSFMRGGMRDDEVVVVADVFGNGLARISEVVEPSHDHRVVEALQKALETDPAYAPFIPSSIENRPETVRVVFRLQSVNVSTRDRRGRTRL